MSFVVGGEGISAEQAGEWIINRLEDEARRTVTVLSGEDISTLRRSIWDDLERLDRSEMVSLNNRVVDLTRSAITHEKAQGATCDKVRRGLSIPSAWRVNYQVVFSQNLPWVLSGILQNAMMNNPFAGERRPWKSK